jgi:hypothetical protein
VNGKVISQPYIDYKLFRNRRLAWKEHPGRCRLHPRSTRSRGKVEPLTSAPSTRGTFLNAGARERAARATICA